MGTVTFLFTDIEGSTRLWEAHPEAMKAALAVHDRQVRRGVESHNGAVFKHTGDGALAAFGSAPDAVQAAAEVQRSMAETAHPDVGALSLRMAIHTGEVEERDDDFFGPPLNRTARLMSVANGGQVLVSLVTERLVEGRLAEVLELKDLGEHRLRDLARPERVFQLVIEGLPSDFPPLQTPDLVPNNLPTLPTSFVGRDQELAELSKLVRGARLVTVTGVGGAGKTRLALQVAAELVDEFHDGAWLIELGGVTDPDLIDAAAASALGVGQISGSLREAILDYLADRQALLIVDNCEHLVDRAAGLVATILSRAPECRLIATSRELLGVGGEVAYGLRSMTLPGGDESVEPAELGRYDAVRLFLERAASARPDFRLSSQIADAVAEICRRLDGMPLALELAAARLRTFSPRQIADNLDQRFRLLTGGSRTAVPRQQTLAAAIDWSYRLLEEAERTLFERLSVFQGGFTLEAVTEVCADDEIDTLHVLELLPALVDKSLVVAEAEAEETRYRLLETLRQFARDRLDESGTADRVRLSHARYFRDLSVAAGRNIRGPDEVLWWGRIDTEMDNLRQAMTWAMDAGEGELALEIATGFWRFWLFMARWSEGVSWLERALRAAGSGAAKALRAEALLGCGSLYATDQHLEAERLLREAIGLFEELDAEGADSRILLGSYPAAYINLSVELEAQGRDPRDLAELNRKALETARRIDDTDAMAVALANLAEFTAHTGDIDEARRLYDESLEAAVAAQSVMRMGQHYWQVGFFELAFGSAEKARAAFRESLIRAENEGVAVPAALGRAYLAVSEGAMGDTSAAERFAADISEAFSLNPELKTSPALSQGLLIMRASLDVVAGDPERAARCLGACQRIENQRTVPPGNFQVIRHTTMKAAQAELGEEAYEGAVASGERLDVEAVVDLLVS